MTGTAGGGTAVAVAGTCVAVGVEFPIDDTGVAG